MLAVLVFVTHRRYPLFQRISTVVSEGSIAARDDNIRFTGGELCDVGHTKEPACRLEVVGLRYIWWVWKNAGDHRGFADCGCGAKLNCDPFSVQNELTNDVCISIAYRTLQLAFADAFCDIVKNVHDLHFNIGWFIFGG